MKKPPKLNLFSRPTPVERLNIDGVEIFVKKDDETGLLCSGNKVRKLEYLLKDALDKGYNSVITCGGVQSNHTRATTYLAIKLGLRPFVMARGEPVLPPQGNFFLNLLLGARFKFITREQFKNVEHYMEEWRKELLKEGFNPYIVPEGGSNALGAWGYVDAMEELKDVIEKEKIEALYFATGSGGTGAGLLIGKEFHNVKIKLVGVLVVDTIEYFTNKINKIVEDFEELYDVKVDARAQEIEFLDGFIGKGYAIPYPEEIETISRIAKYGIILDPVYTGKAFHGMLQHIKERGYRRVMFLHTGGIFSIFAFNEYFQHETKGLLQE